MNQYPDYQGGSRAGEVAGDGQPPHAARPALPLTIQGPSEEVGEEIAQLSPEGTPADAKVGPGLLAIEVGIAAVVFGAIAIGFGYWLGWAAGIALFAIAMMGLAFNPAAIAALLRIRERKAVAGLHNPSEPRVKVIRSKDIESHVT